MHGDADDEEVVGIGEEAHAGDEHDLPVLGRDAGLVELGEVWRCLGDGGRH
jgi:hypothetical protein